MARRALLIAGGVSSTWVQLRYWNNLILFRDALLRAGWDAEDIRLHYENGGVSRWLRDDQVPEIYPSARPADVARSLSWLAELENENDEIVLVASNHGREEGLALWGEGNFLTPDALSGALSPCPARKLLVFGQCRAAAFAQMGLPNAMIAWAADADGDVGAVDADAHFSEFLLHFGSALAGTYPAGLDDLPAIPEPMSVADAAGWVDVNSRRPETTHLEDPAGLATTFTL